MIDWWIRRREERTLRRNEDRAIAHFRKQIAEIERDSSPAIERAKTLKDPRDENLLLSQRFEKTSDLSRCILNLQHARVQRTAHAQGVHVADEDIDRRFRPRFSLLTRDGESRVRCSIGERRRGRWITIITVLGCAATVIGVIVAVVVAVHTWKH